MSYFSIPRTKTCNVIKKTLSTPKSQFFKPINPQNMKSKILKNLCYNNPTSIVRLVGGNNKEWKKELKIEEKVEQPEELEGIALGGDLDVALDKYNRCDCPIFLNPQTATFNDVALHAKLRQRLQNGTINKHLRYARFMETHPMPVDFRNPTIENFIRHMDYREQVEHASPCALEHEWRAMQMFLKAYGIKTSEWQYKPPSRPKCRKRILPYPETVHKFFTYKYTTNKYETALYQYIFFFGFLTGVRAPSEIVNMKVSDVQFESKKRGYIIITETKKHNTQRTIIPEKAILNSKVHKSLKNWIIYWRPKVANSQSGDALFLQPDGKPFTVRHLGHKLSKHGKKIWKHFHPYDMRHWCAVARLIKTKIETGNYDCFTVKNWLGHERMSSTEEYIKYAEEYFRDFPVDWISCSLKPITKKSLAGMYKNKNYIGEIQQNAFFGSVETLPSRC
jgi:integrase